MKRIPLFDLCVLFLFSATAFMVILKLFGYITISWWLVTAPLTVTAAVVLILLVSALLYYVINKKKDYEEF